VLSSSEPIDAATLEGDVRALRTTISERRAKLASVLAKLD
jgi:hypothetical protein